MEKGYYIQKGTIPAYTFQKVAIHNKNGKGLLLIMASFGEVKHKLSQSTIKMEKGYYSKVEKDWR